ncbi:hypothetical protein DWQ65_00045 [Treponema phagedenis]|uniref:Uncharacterized protein n=1 Tax=Treponema phagedenis TaxID=162 RepID=A0A0B7GYM7_TREPH|nr:DUF308 domain-containing protein [Treponema phagedenis]NVP24693.1 DUF308 domain-containing protein [Treponema phagedenis]QEJ95709.1 hypothetical protein FUT79_11180 [Treponema phagedenis]QEJ98809.1 hypothetical protein FUT82_12935 [Treponema phagedenis]QEK00525.1 hypothetical protein FUT84_04605 [Treponema phagedenis]QEK04314.1 hypothetical protein FUT83_11225 [Treponema phagedenis]
MNKNSSLSFFILAVFYLILGILCVSKPETINIIIVTCIGIAIILFGVYQLIRWLYYKGNISGGRINLVSAGILIAAGIFFLLQPKFILAIVGIIFGLFLFTQGILNLSQAIKAKQNQFAYWWIFLCFAILAISFGVYSILNPTEISSFSAVIIGIGFIISGISDIFLLLAYK